MDEYVWQQQQLDLGQAKMMRVGMDTISKPLGFPSDLSWTKGTESLEELKEGRKDDEAKSSVAGQKHDSAKNQLDLVDPDFIEGVGAVLTYGASKYAAWNWTKGISYRRVFSACLRHVYFWWKGEQNDPETGLSHLYAASCNLMFLAHYDKYKDKYKEFDDRYYGKKDANI